MKANRGLLPVLLAAVMVAGCSSTGMDTPTQPKPEGKYIREIDAAIHMKGPDQRARLLIDIASQPDLTEPQQLYLVSRVAEARKNQPVSVLPASRMTSADTRRVLVTLLKNPATTQKTRQFIAETLPSLNLSGEDEQAVTVAIP
jgi:hypothetical protein